MMLLGVKQTKNMTSTVMINTTAFRLFLAMVESAMLFLRALSMKT